MAERAVVTIDVRTDDAEDDVENLQNQLKGAELRAEQLDSALDLDADVAAANAGMVGIQQQAEDATDEVRQLQRALSRVGSADAEADVDTDTDRDRRGLSKIPEVRQARRIFSAVPTKVKALGAAAVTATAAIGAAGGLAAAATALASKFGRQGIQQDIERLKLEFQAAGATFANEFTPVIRNQVIPAGEALAESLSSAADEAATFASFILEALEQGGGGIRQQVEEAGGGVTFNPTATATPTPRDQRVPQRAPSTIQQPGLEDLQNRLQPIIGQLDTEGFGGAAGRGLRLAELLAQTGLPQQEVLKQKVSTLESARQKVAKVAAAFDKGTPEFRAARRELTRLQERINQLQDRLEELKEESKDLVPLGEQLASIGRISPVGAAGQARVGQVLAGQQQDLQAAIAQTAQNVGLAGSPAELGSVFGQQAAEEAEKAKDKAKEFGKTARRQTAQTIRAVGQLGSALARAFDKGKKGAQEVVSILLQSIGGFLTAIAPATGGLSAIPGAVLTASGQLVGSFQEGGTVNTPLQVVGEEGPELASLPQGTQVMSNRDSREALGVGQLIEEQQKTRAKLDSLEVRISAFEAGAEIGRAQGRLERAGDRIYPAKG